MKSGAGLAAIEIERTTASRLGIEKVREMRSDACKVLMIFPRFNTDSFWNYRATCELKGARYPAAPLGLITVAALLPQSWEVRQIGRAHV